LEPATTWLTAGCRRHQAIAQAASAILSGTSVRWTSSTNSREVDGGLKMDKPSRPDQAVGKVAVAFWPAWVAAPKANGEEEA
jgi:hypothetical protein